MPIRLSVNVNKVATLRNSRTPQGGRTSQGGSQGIGVPSVVEATRVCIEAGTPGITVHPRADERHITAVDAREIAAALRATPHIELNIEGDPRPDLVALALELRPTQLTLVPVRPGEITSAAGWRPGDAPELTGVIEKAHAVGTRTSVFVDPDLDAVRWAADLGTDRIELFTEPFARAFATSVAAGRGSFVQYVEAAELAHARGLGINAGHDLDLDNLVLFRELPHLDEVSIGHALMARALFHGLASTVQEYLAVLAGF
jgi:pyridoxine 5-phosphate synthase